MEIAIAFLFIIVSTIVPSALFTWLVQRTARR